MDNILEKIKLIEYHILRLKMSKEDFSTILNQRVENEKKESKLLRPKRIFEGDISDDVFEFKRIQRYILKRTKIATISGKICQDGESLIVKYKVNGFIWKKVILEMIIVLIIIYNLMFFLIKGNFMILLVIPFFLIVVFLVPYLTMKHNMHQVNEEFISMFFKK